MSINLECSGFETTEDVDPSILTVSGAECLFNSGDRIHYQTSIRATTMHAWDYSFAFTLLYSLVSCSN